MKSFLVAFQAEIIKVLKSKVLIVSMAFFAFIALMLALLVYIAGHPEIAQRSAMVSAKTEFIGKGDWTTFLELLIQITLALGTLGYGVVTAWVFGREHSDRTLKDILALPISRTTIVIAKLVVAIGWSLLLCLVLLITAMISGLLFQIPGWSASAAYISVKLFLIGSFLTVLLCIPVAYIANLGRGYLLPVGYTILTMIITQLIFVGLPEIVALVPWALPALVSQITGPEIPAASLLGYGVYFLFIIAGFVATVLWWKKADHI